MSLTLFQAIEEMRNASQKNGGHFAFSFMSYSETKQYSNGIVEVPKARLTTRDKKEHNKNTELMLNYIDLHTGEQHRFYQPLLMVFNGKKVELT